MEIQNTSTYLTLRTLGKLSQLPTIIRDYSEQLSNKEFKLASAKILKFVESNKFKKDIFCLVEYPYVDAQYRDSYYFYHSSKNHHNEKECIRVSFFKDELKSDKLFESVIKNDDNNFLGVLIIRPTKIRQFGRMVLSPSAFELPRIDIISRKFNFSIKGISINIEAFQNSGQDGEFYSCAETSLMSLSSYYSKYDNFNNQLPSNINKLVDKVRVERITSGVGLKQHEISYALKQFGFGTKMYLRNNSEENTQTQFRNAFNDYIQSGIPVLATVSTPDNKQHHSILCIGTDSEAEKELKISSRQKNFTDQGSDFISEENIYVSERQFVFIDDNFAPYRIGTFSKPTPYYNNEAMQNSSISGFVVPLVNRIRMDSVRVRKLFETILQSEYSFIARKIKQHNDFPLVTSFQITTSKSFKNFYCRDTNLEQKLRNTIEVLHLPKFIWLIQLRNVNNIVHNETVGLVIVDPVSPTLSDSVLFQYFNGILQVNKYNISGYNQDKQVKDKFIKHYSNNLKTF